MNTQHTPGPWAVDLDRDFTLGGDYCQVEALTPDGMVSRDICECPLDTDDHPDGPEWNEDAANARLIAAAPEMFAALEGILADDDSSVSLADQRARWTARMDAGRAALAKASGQNVQRVGPPTETSTNKNDV